MRLNRSLRHHRSGETEIAGHLYELQISPAKQPELTLQMGVNPKNGGFSPQIIHFNRDFHYKSSILGYPFFWKHPNCTTILCAVFFFPWRVISCRASFGPSTPIDQAPHRFPTRRSTSASGSWLSLPCQPPPVWVKFMENWNENTSEDVFMIQIDCVLKKIF